MSEEKLHWKSHDTRIVMVGNVHVVGRILPPTKARVDAMAKSLSGPLGQLQPILVTKYLHSAWKVVAGATRLLAAKQLGWKEISATIISADNDIEYALIEIAENLDRHDLSATERTRLKKKEKELRQQRLEEIAESAPEKAKGGRGKRGGLRDAARKAGVPESTARDQKNKLRENSSPRSLGNSSPSSSTDDTESQAASTIETTRPPPTKPPSTPKPELIKCPLCHGKGQVPRVEAETESSS